MSISLSSKRQCHNYASEVYVLSDRLLFKSDERKDSFGAKPSDDYEQLRTGFFFSRSRIRDSVQTEILLLCLPTRQENVRIK